LCELCPELHLTRDKFGATCLHSACRYGSVHVIRVLCEMYPELHLAKDCYGRTCLHHAQFYASHNKREVMTILSELCPHLKYRI
jgi:ankyrin repeat protein